MQCFTTSTATPVKQSLYKTVSGYPSSTVHRASNSATRKQDNTEILSEKNRRQSYLAGFENIEKEIWL